MSQTRAPVLSGTWYPADPAELSALVDGFLALSDPAQLPAGRPLIAIAPHAGYVYSGATAGHLYGLLSDHPPGRIFILSPNHRTALDQVALSSAAAFATPLGDIPLDTATVTRLANHPLFGLNDEAHAQEHAIEIQLPLLQRTWPTALPTIIPLLVPALSHSDGHKVSQALAAEMDDDSLLLVSTDFTHYGASYGYVPFNQDIPDSLERLDAGAILRVLAGDGDGLRDYGHETGITMCGLEPTAVALDCGLPDGYEGGLLHYSRSGDRDDDYTLSVSYAAILLCSGPDTNN